MDLAFTNKMIDRYFGFLSRLDNGTKKKLIKKLSESITEEEEKNISLQDLSGKWEDSRTSDEIIKEIRESRVNKSNDDGDF